MNDNHIQLKLYTELLHAFWTQIEHFCWRHGRDDVDSDVLLDRVLQTLWKGMRTLRPDSTPRQRNRWLQVVMQRVLSDHFATSRPLPVQVDLDAHPLPSGDYDSELLDALLQHLSDSDREFLEERFQGYSPAEQAQRRGTTVDAIHHRYSRLVHKLKIIYEKYYAHK